MIDPDPGDLEAAGGPADPVLTFDDDDRASLLRGTVGRTQAGRTGPETTSSASGAGEATCHLVSGGERSTTDPDVARGYPWWTASLAA